jgi:hypothetical protein
MEQKIRLQPDPGMVDAIPAKLWMAELGDQNPAAGKLHRNQFGP